MNKEMQTIVLPEAFTVKDVDRLLLHSRIDELLTNNPALKVLFIDLNKLRSVDACALQYIISIAAVHKPKGLDIAFVDPSEEFLKTLSLLGLDTYFSFSKTSKN